MPSLLRPLSSAAPIAAGACFAAGARLAAGAFRVAGAFRAAGTFRVFRVTAGAAALALVLTGAPIARAAEPGNAAPTGAAVDVAAAPSDTAAANSPVPMIEAFHAGLLDIMKDAKTLGFEGRIEKLAPLMGRTFDLEFMASKTVGRHWSTLSPADKQRWIETFTRFTTANYAGRFKGYTGEQFVTLGTEDAGHDTRLVLTRIDVPGDEPVELNYRVMQEKSGQWRVIDVYLDGKVSELTLRRSEYASALKRDGFEQLCDSVETKIAELKSKGRSDG